MDSYALNAAAHGDLTALIIALTFMLVSSVLGAIAPSFGWGNKAEREANLVSKLQDISRDGDMDEEIAVLKASITRRVKRAYGNGFWVSLKRIALFRFGHFLATMVLMLLVGVFNNMLQGQYYASADNWNTFWMIALFVLGFELIMGVVYMVVEWWCSNDSG